MLDEITVKDMFRNLSIPTMVFIIIVVGLLLTNAAGFGSIVGAAGPQLVNFIRALSARPTANTVAAVR